MGRVTTSLVPAFKKFKFDSFGTGNFGTGKMHGTESTFTIYSSKSGICIFKSPNASATSSKFGSVRPSTILTEQKKILTNICSKRATVFWFSNYIHRFAYNSWTRCCDAGYGDYIQSSAYLCVCLVNSSKYLCKISLNNSNGVVWIECQPIVCVIWATITFDNCCTYGSDAISHEFALLSFFLCRGDCYY